MAGCSFAFAIISAWKGFGGVCVGALRWKAAIGRLLARHLVLIDGDRELQFLGELGFHMVGRDAIVLGDGRASVESVLRHH